MGLGRLLDTLCVRIWDCSLIDCAILMTVTQRATSWFLTALIALCAAGAAPAIGRIRHSEEPSAVVWMARQRAEQNVANRNPRRCPPPDLAAPSAPQVLSASPLLSDSLYQRPPPFLLA